MVRLPFTLADNLRASHIAGPDVVPADFSLRHLDLHLDGTKHPTERLASVLAGVEVAARPWA